MSDLERRNDFRARIAELEAEREVYMASSFGAKDKRISDLEAALCRIADETDNAPYIQHIARAALSPKQRLPRDERLVLDLDIAAARIAELEAERDSLKAALKNIARQMTVAEHDERHPEGGGDVDLAYDTIIGVARAALSSTASGDISRGEALAYRSEDHGPGKKP